MKKRLSAGKLSMSFITPREYERISNKTFSLIVTVPALEGIYKFQWQMKQEGGDWIGEPSDNSLVNVGDNVSFLDDCDALNDWSSPVIFVGPKGMSADRDEPDGKVLVTIALAWLTITSPSGSL